LRVGNTSDFAGFSRDNNKFGSCVVPENSGYDLGKYNKYNVVEASFEKDVSFNH